MNIAQPRLYGILTLALCLGAGTAPSDDGALSSFKSWFRKYKKGEIELYQPSPVPILQNNGSPTRYHSTEAVKEMNALFQGLADRNDLKATMLLVEAASFRFDRRREMEIKNHFKKQPWRLRTRALEALQMITDQESLEWLRNRCLKSDSNWDAPFRRVIAASIFRGERNPENGVLLRSLLKDRDDDVREEALAGLKSAGGAGDLDDVIELLTDRIPSVRVAAVEALVGILTNEKNDQPSLANRCLPLVARRLEDPEWPVQDAVLTFMNRFRSPRSIPVLIDFLEKIAGDPERYRDRITHRTVDVLQSLTGASIPGIDPEQWRAWWLEKKYSFEMPTAPPPKIERFQLDSAYFFNIPVNSDYVYFILDTSGSMRSPLSSDDLSTTGNPDTKLDRAREELVKTLDALVPDVYFNLFLFNETIHRFSEEPLRAEADARKGAKAFFEAVEPEGGTNIFDALNLALQIKSMGLVERFRKDLQVDTIFLLSDGVPTTGVVIDPEEILRIITKANRLARIKINTIYLGVEPSPFMQKLAEKNFGRYVHIQ